MIARFCALTLALIVSVSHGLGAQESELVVGEVNLPNLRWGYQSANFEVTNKTEDVKFIVALTTIQYPDGYLNPIRKTRTNYVLGPLESKIFTPRIFVPGNFGRAEIKVELYDVIDTVDVLLPRQRVYFQPISVTYHLPEAVRTYMSERITLPPIVNGKELWDNEVSRLLLLFMRERKTVPEIAAMLESDETFITSQLEELVVHTAAVKTDSGYFPRFCVITAPEAEEFRVLAHRMADSLVKILKSNLPAYEKILKEMVARGSMSGDSLDFLNPGGFLYYRYPALGLFLWSHLGREFITEKRNLVIFEGTDFCVAYHPFYMYAVHGGAVVNGRHFYSWQESGTDVSVHFADSIPMIECEEGFRFRLKEGKGYFWGFAEGDRPEGFVFSTAVTDTAFVPLRMGVSPLIESTRSKLLELIRTRGINNFAHGPKYYFWNLVATRTLEKLTAEGVITRRGNGHYKWISI